MILLKNAEPFGSFTRSAVLFSLILCAAVLIFEFLRCSPLEKSRFEKGMKRMGLKNAQGEYPVLVSSRKDPNKPHGKVLRIANKGLSVLEFENKIKQLEAVLGGKIYEMCYGKNTTQTFLYLMPFRYITPYPISPDDDCIGRYPLHRFINMLVIGATGTGKTVALKIIMAKIARFQPQAKIYLLDFKRFDFQEFSELSRYYGYTDCIKGLNYFYAAFKHQQELGAAAEPNYLVIDEWASMLLSLEKKQAEELKAKLAEILMLGRAYKFYPIVGIQRPDAAFLPARDNFGACLALGNLSPEGQRMVFPHSMTEKIELCKKREGYLYIDGGELEKVKIADVANIAALNDIIIESMKH